MTSRRRNRGDQEPFVDKLESGLLPPELEDAQAEYFADMAFDDRLINLLEAEPKTITIDATGNSKDLVGEGIFKANSLVYEIIQIGEDEPLEELPINSFSFRAKGTIVELPGELQVNLSLSSDADNQPTMYVQSNPKDRDSFFVYRDGLIDMASQISTIELAQLTMMACGLDATARKQLRLGMGENPTGYRPITSQLWKNLGERSGEMIESAFLIQDLLGSTADLPQRGKLAYVTRETPSESTITMTLQHVTDFPDLDSQEVYTLRLVYAHSGHTNLDKDAKKIITTGIMPPTLQGIEMTHTSLGTTRPLNIYEPAIQQLFVDTFDQVIAA